MGTCTSGCEPWKAARNHRVRPRIGRLVLAPYNTFGDNNPGPLGEVAPTRQYAWYVQSAQPWSSIIPTDP